MLHMDIPGSIQLSSEAVNSLLYRQAALGPTVPYKWSFIDKPKGPTAKQHLNLY